jgi:hypothetical protein
MFQETEVIDGCLFLLLGSDVECVQNDVRFFIHIVEEASN